MEKRTATCTRCKNKFEYRGGAVRSRARCICDDCRAAVKKQKWKDRRERQRLLEQEGSELNMLARMDRAEVAKVFGVSPGRVLQIERDALSKIRQNQEALGAYLSWKREGMPVALDQGCVEDSSMRLLEWQLEIAEWYGVHERLSEGGCEDEARECLSEITRCQVEIKKVLGI